MKTTIDETKTRERIAELEARRAQANVRLAEARSSFLVYRAQRNYWRARIKRLDDEIELYRQGQLCLGDEAGGQA